MEGRPPTLEERAESSRVLSDVPQELVLPLSPTFSKEAIVKLGRAFADKIAQAVVEKRW